ncbi:MAG: MFS transporter [bacterium]|nr:MFS transporter [bacterium]
MTQPFPRRGIDRKVVLSIWVPAACMALGSGLILPVLPLFALSFDASYSMVGLVLAARGLGNLAFDVPAGMAVRRLGVRRSMIVGGTIMVLCALAMTQVRTLTEALVVQLLLGLTMALWNIARHTYITETVEIERRGRTNAVMGGIGRISGFGGPVIGGAMAEWVSLTAPFAVQAGLIALGVLAAILWVDRDVSRQERLARPHAGAWQVLAGHWRVLVSAGSGQMCAQTIRAARNAVVPLFTAEVLGLDAGSVGLIISLSYATDMLMFYPAGQLMDRRGRKWAYVPSFIIQSLAMALVPLTNSFWTLALVTMAIGLGNGLGSGTMLTLGADLAPERGRGEFLGMWRFIGDGGSAAGPMIVGQVAQVAGLHLAPVVIAGIGLMGAALLGGLVPETLRRKR